MILRVQLASHCPSMAPQPLLERNQWWKIHHSYNRLIRKFCSTKSYPNQPKSVKFSHFHTLVLVFPQSKIQQESLISFPSENPSNTWKQWNPQLKSRGTVPVLLTVVPEVCGLWLLTSLIIPVEVPQGWTQSRTHTPEGVGPQLPPNHNLTPASHLTCSLSVCTVQTNYPQTPRSFHECWEQWKTRDTLKVYQLGGGWIRVHSNNRIWVAGKNN